MIFGVFSGAEFANGASVTLIWDASPDEAVSSYRVYYGLSSQSYVGFVETDEGFSATIQGLADGTTYYFAATAVTEDGYESGFSNEVKWTTPPTLEHALAIKAITKFKVVLAAHGAPGEIYEIEVSSDLLVWKRLRIIAIPPEGSFTCVHSGAPARMCFYRTTLLGTEAPMPASADFMD